MGQQIEEFIVKWRGDVSGFKKAAGEGKKANEEFLESENKVKRALVDVTGTLGNSGSAVDALAGSVGALENAFKSSLGIGAAVVVGLKLKEVLEGNAKRMNELSDAAGEVFGASGMNAQIKGVGELAEGYKKAADAAEKFRGLRGGGELVSGLDKEALRIQREMAKVEEHRADLAEKIAEGRESEVAEILKAEAREKELAAAVASHNVGGLEGIKRRHDAEDAAEERREKFLELELDHRNAIDLAIRSGVNAELAGAEALLTKRMAISKLTTDPAQKAAASADVDDASNALNAIRRRTQAEFESLAVSKEIAELHGSDFQRTRDSLKIAEQRLKVEQLTADAARQIAIQTELANNARAQATNDKSEALGVLGVRELRANAVAGAGPEDQIKLQVRLMQIKQAELEIEKASADRDIKKVENLKSQIVLQGKAVDAAIAEKTIRDATFNAEKKKVEIEAGSASEAAKRYNATLAEIAAVEAIIAAQKRLNSGVERESLLRKEVLTNSLAAQDRALNMGKSSREIQERFRDERKATRDQEKFDKQRKEDSGLIDVHKDVNGNVISGKNPVTGDTETRSPKSGLDTGRGAGLDAERGGSLKDRLGKPGDDFNKRFHPDQSGAADTTAMPAAEKASDDPVVNAINDVKTAILEAIAK